MKNQKVAVGVIMGSLSDLEIMKKATRILEDFEIGYEIEIVSAHRTPEKMVDYAKSARDRGLRVIISGAGGAAHLPGMTASLTDLPVIGVPIKSSNSIDGWDSVLSILQMPSGVPVATVALNGSENAGILAVQILGSFDEEIAEKLKNYKLGLQEKVKTQNQELNK
jgi:5-(carboxyamino)imidazole ribonucleotide mutase